MIVTPPETVIGEGAHFWSSFILLPENRSALRAMQHLAEELLTTGARSFPTPLLLHGMTGTGKSLLTDCLIRAITTQSDCTAQVLPAREWPEDTADLLSCDLIILEDFHHLPVRVAEAVCQILDRRRRYRRPTVITSAAGPAGLKPLPQRLTSRLSAGLVLGLEPVSTTSRRILLQGFAERRNLALSAEVIDWLIARTPGSGARPLSGRIEQLARLAAGRTEPLDLPTVVQWFAPDSTGEAVAEPATLDWIVRRVSTLFAVSPDDVIGPSRVRSLAAARQLAMYLARDLTRASLPQIGRFFGNRDHTTVLHACRMVEAALTTDQKLSRTVRELKAELG